MRSFAVYLIGIVVILGYNLIILTRLNGAPRLTTLASNACTLLDGPFSLLRKHAQTDFSSTYKLYDHRNCHDISAVGDFELIYRPVVGDHIHLGMVLSDEGRLHVLHDRQLLRKRKQRLHQVRRGDVVWLERGDVHRVFGGQGVDYRRRHVHQL